MAGSPYAWLKREYFAGRLQASPEALARWPELAPYVPSPLQDAVLSTRVLTRSGAEYRGECPACAGTLSVGRERWRCLGCGAQEAHGSDLAGWQAWAQTWPKA